MDFCVENKNRCITQNKVTKFDFTWTIENFSFCEEELGECLGSSTFSANPDDERQPKWRLELYPKGKFEESKDCVSLFLHLDKNNQTTEPVSAKYNLYILKANGGQTNVMGSRREVRKFEQSKGWGFEKFIGRDFLLNPKNGLLPNDQLSIFCEVSMVVEKGAVPQIRLSEDFGALLEKGLLTDCVLCSSDGKEFQVHKAVLACRSPVFAAMFTNDTEEKQTGRVNISDVTAPVLSQLLHFLYTGCEPKLLAEEDMAGELLAAADKYQLDRLKAICEQQLCASLDKENVCKMLALADLHSAEHLKSRAIEYIHLHMDEVVETEGWRTLFPIKTNVELHKQLFRASRKRGGQESGGTADQEPKQRKL